MFKKYLVVLALVMITYGVAFGQDYSIFSPNHNIAIEVKVNDSISLDVLYKGQLVLADVQMGLVFNGLKKFENIKSVAITNKNVVLITFEFATGLDMPDTIGMFKKFKVKKFGKSSLAYYNV